MVIAAVSVETSAGNQIFQKGPSRALFFYQNLINYFFKTSDKTLNLQGQAMSYFGKFLLIDNDNKIKDLVHQDKNLLEKYPSAVVRTITEAGSVLEKNGQEFRTVFFSERLGRICDLSELKKLIEKHPAIQFVLIADKTELLAARELLPITIAKPETYMDFVKHVQKQLNDLHDWRKNENDGQEKEREFIAEDIKYIEIPARDFVITPKSYFNTYLRISQGKFIKIFNAGDDLSKDEVDRYRAKGIDEFFVPKDEHEKFIRLQGTLAAKVVQSDMANNLKIKTIMKLGANVTNNLLKCGITPDRMDNAQIFLDQSIVLLRQMKLKDEVITSFLKNIDQDEHTSAVAFISGILANHLGFESSKSIKVVGTTALLHDIGLYALDPDFEEGEELGDEKKKDIFLKHSAHGAELLRASKAFEEVICHAVENHHRRRKGENASRRSSSVNLITEIVSVSDEFFNIVIHHGYSPEKVRFFMDNELKNYSPNVERAFHVLTKGKKAA